jgi:hypothetical protein
MSDDGKYVTVPSLLLLVTEIVTDNLHKGLPVHDWPSYGRSDRVVCWLVLIGQAEILGIVTSRFGRTACLQNCVPNLNLQPMLNPFVKHLS